MIFGVLYSVTSQRDVDDTRFSLSAWPQWSLGRFFASQAPVHSATLTCGGEHGGRYERYRAFSRRMYDFPLRFYRAVYRAATPRLCGRLESEGHSLQSYINSSASLRCHTKGLCDSPRKRQQREQTVGEGANKLHVPLFDST